MDFTRLVAKLLRLRDELTRIINLLMFHEGLERPYAMGLSPDVDTLLQTHLRKERELRALENQLGLRPDQLPDDATVHYARKLVASV
jgi:hypothetical protein